MKKQTAVVPASYITLQTNIDFTPAVDQPFWPSYFFSYPGQQWFKSRVFEIPPSNSPRYLQFYAARGNYFFQ